MNLNEKFSWISVGNVYPKSFTCGHCGNQIASNFGYGGSGVNSNRSSSIYICHFCTRPTYFDPDGEQIPGKAYGNDINEISDKGIQALFHEARNATSSNCYTAAILCCRKLLMHIAVSKGAKVGESFADYVEYLSKNNFVPPDAKIWVDHIRKNSRERPAGDGDSSEDLSDTFFDERGSWSVKPLNWESDPGEVLTEKEFWQTLQRCLSDLPLRMAHAFALRELEEVEGDEISRIMEISQNNLGVVLHRARLRLRRCLEVRWFS